MPDIFAVDAEGSGDRVTREVPKPKVEKFTKNTTKRNFGRVKVKIDS